MKEKGQVLVEAVMVAVLFFGLLFGLIQLFLISTTKLLTQDAAFFAARARAVRKSPSLAVYYLLSHRVKREGLMVLPKTSTRPVRNYRRNSRGEVFEIIDASVDYFQKMMFPSFFSTFGIRSLPGRSGASFIASPEPVYFNVSYPGSKKDG